MIWVASLRPNIEFAECFPECNMLRCKGHKMQVPLDITFENSEPSEPFGPTLKSTPNGWKNSTTDHKLQRSGHRAANTASEGWSVQDRYSHRDAGA